MTPHCSSCPRFVSPKEGIYCAGGCGKLFHKECAAALAKVSLEDMQAGLRFVCSKCPNLDTDASPSSSPASSNSYRSPLQTTSSATKKATLDDILHSMKSYQSSLENKLSEITMSIRGVESMITDLHKDVNDLVGANKVFNERLDTFETRVTTITSVCDQLKNNDVAHTADIRKLSVNCLKTQASVTANEICISGVPVKENENLLDLCHKLFDTIEAEVPANGILDVFRIKPKKGRSDNVSTIPKIVVKLASTRFCGLIFAAIRARKAPLSAAMLSSSLGNGRIYVNPNTPSTLYHLFKKAKSWASHQGEFKSVRIRSGSVLFITNDGTSYTVIDDEGLTALMARFKGGPASTS